MLEESPEAAPHHRTAISTRRVREAEPRRQVVPVDRVVVRGRKRWIVRLVDRDDLDFIAHSKAQRQLRSQLPFVLNVSRSEMRTTQVVGAANADRELIGVAARIRSIEWM